MTTSARVAVVGYASMDSATSMREFRGIDATSILDRAIVSTRPGVGGIAHLTSAVASAGGHAEAIGCVGHDSWGQLWTQTVAASGTGTSGVAIAGARTPSATLIEIGSGGTICLFDPGDCHPSQLTPQQTAVVHSSDWVLLTVAPRSFTTQLLDVLPAAARLVWAVKHDEDAYTPAIVRRILERADIVSFSRGERSYVTIDGVEPERIVRPGGLVIETRGADGVAWSFASMAGATRRGILPVERVDADDTTGAGDTFIGTLVGLASLSDNFTALTDVQINALVTTASTAAGDLLRQRTHFGRSAAEPQKEIH
jgi:sugar/nucleoside kinase (ribokinase family)